MKILERLFGKESKTANTIESKDENSTIEVGPNPENVPSIDLFVESNPPQHEEQLSLPSKSRMTIFLERNYHNNGSKDGYECHSSETLETGKKKIRAEFNMIIDQMIEEKSEKRLQLRMMVINVEQFAEQTKRNLELTIEELNASISKLQKQKELCVENEGWVMNAIHSYHQGFVQGLNDYISEENLLNSFKNI